jgi:hypothetical protein
MSPTHSKWSILHNFHLFSTFFVCTNYSHILFILSILRRSLFFFIFYLLFDMPQPEKKRNRNTDDKKEADGKWRKKNFQTKEKSQTTSKTKWKKKIVSFPSTIFFIDVFESGLFIVYFIFSGICQCYFFHLFFSYLLATSHTSDNN